MGSGKDLGKDRGGRTWAFGLLWTPVSLEAAAGGVGGAGGEGGVWPSHATPAGALSPQAFGLLPLATVSREEGRTRHMF